MTWFTGSTCCGAYSGILILTIQCAECDHENRDEARFCTACGVSLVLRCPACGAIPLAQASFCDACGASLEINATLAEPDPAAAVDTSTERAGSEAERRHLTVLFGLLIYFGYPRAHEDDAPRALRAALEIAKAVDQLEPSLTLPIDGLAVRIGIATGTVVVGDIGSGRGLF
jgi:hypothetical protein